MKANFDTVARHIGSNIGYEFVLMMNMLHSVVCVFDDKSELYGSEHVCAGPATRHWLE